MRHDMVIAPHTPGATRYRKKREVASKSENNRALIFIFPDDAEKISMAQKTVAIPIH